MNSKTFGQPHFYFTVLVSTGVAVHIESAVTLEAQIFSMPGIFQCPDFSIAQIFSGFSGIKIGRRICS